LKLSKEL